MAIPEDTFDAARARAGTRLARTPTVDSACYDPGVGRVMIALSNGLHIGFRPQDAQGLENATPDDLSRIEVSPSGLGLHFPALDADLYLPALLSGWLGSRHWMAASMGKVGGQRTSEAKAAAARANGKLGGRPRKSKVFGVK